MAIAANLGFPRVGAKRELKTAVESFWKGETTEQQLLQTAAELRARHWRMQQEAGIEHIPSSDFSLYDHVLDMAACVGAVPERFGFSGDEVGLSTYFAMARGGKSKDDARVAAMEMTKWFDTNYHYIVPEFTTKTQFRLASQKPVEEFKAAKELGIHTRPVLLGPVSFLLLGKMKDSHASPLSLLEGLLPVYETLLARLAEAGAEWVQVDEPFLALDLEADAKTAFAKAYSRLSQAAPKLKFALTSYFAGLHDNMDLAFSLPVAAVHLDLVRAPEQLEGALAKVPAGMLLSLGVIDGRNIWRADLDEILAVAEKAAAKIGKERIIIAPSCSMLHSPIDLEQETALDDELKSWLAFAAQKLVEVAAVATALDKGREAARRPFEGAKKALAARKTSKRIHNPEVGQRLRAITPDMYKRAHPFVERQKAQADIALPPLPTTTIGSFPQTQEVRHARAEFKKGKMDLAAYEKFLKEETDRTIRIQEKIGLDVLVHGEFERNDMVEYFGEQLEGFAFTQHGWVQSYGSRCVKPPIIFGDVSRPKPMTVRWSEYAQSLTSKPMKGMLTGPVTILQWSFVRNDQPRSATCKQIALAIRDEVVDLEKAGLRMIQIDEPAIREGLPLRESQWKDYLTWAVDAFRLSASGVEDRTQIHTHMCYSEFNDIMQEVADMDADVISIESSRSDMELLKAFVDFRYPNEIGPGVYDIHSPRIPTAEEMAELLRKALRYIPAEQLWVNPDCGLKTRGWLEVKAALENMVEAAAIIRRETAGAKMRANG